MQLVVDRELVPELQVQRGSLFQFIGEVTQFQARALSRSPPHPTPSPLTLRGACSRSCSCGRAWLASWMGWTSSSTTRRCRCAAHSRRRWPPPPPRPEEPPPRPTPPRRCSNEGDGYKRGGDGAREKKWAHTPCFSDVGVARARCVRGCRGRRALPPAPRPAMPARLSRRQEQLCALQTTRPFQQPNTPNHARQEGGEARTCCRVSSGLVTVCPTVRSAEKISKSFPPSYVLSPCANTDHTHSAVCPPAADGPGRAGELGSVAAHEEVDGVVLRDVLQAEGFVPAAREHVEADLPANREPAAATCTGSRSAARAAAGAGARARAQG